MVFLINLEKYPLIILTVVNSAGLPTGFDGFYSDQNLLIIV